MRVFFVLSFEVRRIKVMKLFPFDLINCTSSHRTRTHTPIQTRARYGNLEVAHGPTSSKQSF